MNEDNLEQRAKELNITDEELGFATDADALEAAPELSVQKEQKKLPQVNELPVPPGTPDNRARLYKAIPTYKALCYKKIWDCFENKDMTLVDFSIEMECLTNTALMQDDLCNFVLSRRVIRN